MGKARTEESAGRGVGEVQGRRVGGRDGTRYLLQRVGRARVRWLRHVARYACTRVQLCGRHSAVHCCARRAVAQAEMLAADLRAKEEVSKGVGALSIEQQQQQDASAQAPFLLEALDTWESFAGGAAAAGAKAPARLYRGPYPYAAVPVRPIMLDTASNCLSYPSLEHRLRKAEKKSVLSSLFSWRR